MPYVLGIDGGGTKTTGVIANQQGETIVQVTVGVSNPNLVDERKLAETFVAMKQAMIQKNEPAFYKVTHLFAGISGAGHPDAQKRVYDVLRDMMPELSDIVVDNDAIIALYSGTFGGSGIVQISGTGSITYGVNAEGERERVGGWGHLVGEKGSGYGLGHDALKAAFAARDGMEAGTLLQDKLLAFFKQVSLPGIIPCIYQSDNPKETVASISGCVIEAAEQGDRVSKDIIRQHGLHIGKSIAVLGKTLFTEDKAEEGVLPIVLTGGLLNRLDLFQEPIVIALNQLNKETNIISPQRPPVMGAVSAALMRLKS